MSLSTALLALALSSGPPPASFTYPELVGRLTDLPRLAALPTPGEATALASSYDRSSQYDASMDRYLDWGADSDGAGFIRREGAQVVLADIQGPGCIWRIWSATPKEGHVKIYLDGEATPTVDLPFRDYFSGGVEPFTRPQLVYALNGKTEPPGFNNYTPISFRRSCRIVADEGWGRYYQFTYSRFPEGTEVPTFRMKLSAPDAAALDRANAILAACGQPPAPPTPGAHSDVQALRLGAYAHVALPDLVGPQAITALKVKLQLPPSAEAQRVLLRQLTLTVTWDDERSPAIWSPLGDFFGFVGGAKPYRSLPMGLLDDGTFYSYWYMPFGRVARVAVGNDGPLPVDMTWEITREPLTKPLDALARFHAKWHRDAYLPKRPGRAVDWTLLTTHGRGRYVGTHLHGWNPRGGWWGEGDDKFFIDGEMFPSSFGTGSEDYFGYAWSSAKVFSRPYHGQLLNERNAGHFDDNRWHIADSVPFQSSFEGDLEKYFQNRRPTLYAAEAFWYLEAGGDDPYPPLPLSDRIGYWSQPPRLRPHLEELP